ncbi:MAG TPA: Hpt domain-containing protein [Casimicrobiaceae bacterium]|nr:Hpt domain-containing protein [Casimicrobiaceae bacterium]
MLGLDDAERLLALCQEQIDKYATQDAPVENEELELLAESLSGLGFYVEAVEQQRPDRERLIAPLIAKRIGEPATVPAAPETESVEDAVASLRAALPQLVAEAHSAGGDAQKRDALKAKLAGLRDDAELIGDAELVSQANAALEELAKGGVETLAAAVEVIADTGAAPAPEVSEETQRLLATDASQLDAELLDIYLTEASEVLDTIASGLESLKANRGDRDALTTVRRQFHTLKGSGRMVGLTQLGELAWEVERTHNRLLEEDRPVTGAVLALIEVALRDFREWVDALRTHGRVTADPEPLLSAVRAVENELPGGVTLPPPSAKPVKPVQLVPIALEPPPPPVEAAPAPPPVEATPPHAVPTFEPELPDLIDLPELGAVQSSGPTVISEAEAPEETIEVGVPPPSEPQKPHLRVVADNTLSSSMYAFDRQPEAPSTLESEPASFAQVEAAPDIELHGPEVEPIDEAPAADMSTHLEHAPATDIGVPVEHAPATDIGVPVEHAPAMDTSAHVEQVLAEPVEEAVPGPESAFADEVTIGSVTLSTSLWKILCDEADQHVATLNHELSLLQFDSLYAPSEAMIRASHTLCGIHRTAGIPLIATTAKALEQTLIALQQHGAPIPTSALPVLARAIAGLADFVVRVKARFAFMSTHTREGEQIQEELEALRQQAVASEAPVDAEAAAAELALREEKSDSLGEAPSESFAAPERALATITPLHTAAADQLVAAASEAAADAALATLHDEVDENVLPIFLEEAAELFPQAGEQLRSWRRNAPDATFANQLRRTLHTFKGSARMAGAMRLGELAHRMESRMMPGDSLAAPTPELFEGLDTDLDHIAFVLDALRQGNTNVALPWLELGEAAVLSPPEKAPITEVVAPVTATPPEAERPIVVPIAPVQTAPVVTPAAAAPVPQRTTVEPADVESGARAMLRVRADTIDRLVNEAGEVAIARARIEGELRALKSNLLELTGSVIRLRSQVREIELQAETQIASRMTALQSSHEGFDPLEMDRYTRFQELTRSLAEGVNDVSTVQQSLLKNLDDADAALLAQSRLSRDVQQRLFAIRTVPFGSLSERLYRIMRTTARELDKRVNLEIHGAQSELDRSVLEKLVGPLEHLLRNALDHGIESPEARKAAGKSETGELSLTVRQVGNEILIELADDGAGIDFVKVRERAVAAGLLAADATPSELQLIELLFQPGFTTASRVTQISGRGIGMDVVRSEIVALGGRVAVQTASGKGSQFNLYLPLTLAVAQAVLVRAGGRLWALPAPMVEQVQQIKPEALLDLYVRKAVQWQGQTYPFHYLPRLLGDTAHIPESQRYNSVLLLRSGQGLAGIHVDEMVGNQEVVVKNIGPQLARVSGISGATVLGTGEIVLIINPVQLAQRADVQSYDPQLERSARPQTVAAPAKPERPLVMIVDDSLTVRKITSRLLGRAGFDVSTAKDGMDALQLLGERIPDAILLDIEMPRMDGFEFTKTIKGDARFATIPIVMITSRTAEKHRNRAAELGVDLYLGKPFQEEELLRHLRDMLGLTVAA